MRSFILWSSEIYVEIWKEMTVKALFSLLLQTKDLKGFGYGLWIVFLYWHWLKAVLGCESVLGLSIYHYSR